MREEQKSLGAVLLYLWRTRRSFRGFGLLLFYCHMLMLFSVLTRVHLAEAPEYAMLIRAGKVLVPLLFTLTTLSLFISLLFWPALCLGFLHVPFAVYFIALGPGDNAAWLLGLVALTVLLLGILYTRLRK